MEQMSKDGRLCFLSFASMALFSLQVELEFIGGFLFSDFFFFFTYCNEEIHRTEKG